LRNDFEHDAAQMVPVVATALNIARESFPHSTSLTGSGSAIFSLVAHDEGEKITSYSSKARAAGMEVHTVRLRA
jgi:4-diphosphocytidyl-2C-methyl-D-erythritol kinase